MKGMARNVRRPDRASPEDSDAPAASTEPVAHEESPPAAVTSGEPDEGPIVEVGDAEETQSLPAAEEPGELAQTRPTTSARGSDRGDGDPSLRELFWGEEE